MGKRTDPTPASVRLCGMRTVMAWKPSIPARQTRSHLEAAALHSTAVLRGATCSSRTTAHRASQHEHREIISISAICYVVEHTPFRPHSLSQSLVCWGRIWMLRPSWLQEPTNPPRNAAGLWRPRLQKGAASRCTKRPGEMHRERRRPQACQPPLSSAAPEIASHQVHWMSC